MKHIKKYGLVNVFLDYSAKPVTDRNSIKIDAAQTVFI